MNERLRAILEQFGGQKQPTEQTIDLGDGKVVQRRADGKVFVTMPGTNRSAMFGPTHGSAPRMSQHTLRVLGCTEKTPWQPGKLVLVTGRHSDSVGAALGMLAAEWGPRHAPVRYVGADTAPHEWQDHERRPVQWALPDCATLIIGKVWPSSSNAQLHFVLRACQERRNRSVIVCADVPDEMSPAWRALVDYASRDGVVQRVTEGAGTSPQPHGPARGGAAFPPPLETARGRFRP